MDLSLLRFLFCGSQEEQKNATKEHCKEVGKWVLKAVPSMGEPRSLKLAEALIVQDLTPAALIAFASLKKTSATAVMAVLSFDTIYFDLSQGEKLALAVAVMAESEGEGTNPAPSTPGLFG